jgi:quercetin dioxygenase-like cupin family protein
MFLRNISSRAQFSAEKMGKTTLFQGAQLFAGLNAFEPGQEHAAHAHAGQDKLYVVMEGECAVTVGEAVQELGPGDAAFAPSGVLHAIRNTGTGRLVVMAVLAPPPATKA